MTRGILVFARNNSHIDYVKQACFLATQAKKHLNLPVSIATDAIEYVDSFPTLFDNVISLPLKDAKSNKRYFDGNLAHKYLEFKNDDRSSAYDITPYDETLLLDTDIIINCDKYLSCFKSMHNLMLYRKSYDLAGFRDYREFKYIYNTGIPFYWATCVFFRKSEINKIFFDLLKHIQDNWYHYRSVFKITTPVFRNDFLWSIGIHIMNGYTDGGFAGPMPGKLYFTTDKDILYKINGTETTFLIEKENYLGEYTLVKFNGTIHVMNKFSLEREINGLI